MLLLVQHSLVAQGNAGSRKLSPREKLMVGFVNAKVGAACLVDTASTATHSLQSPILPTPSVPNGNFLQCRLSEHLDGVCLGGVSRDHVCLGRCLLVDGGYRWLKVA